MKLKYLLLIIGSILMFSKPQTYGAIQQSKEKTHIVSKGETIYSIASAYKVSVQDIYDLNPEAKKGIRTNQTIQIPTENKAIAQSSVDYVLHSIQSKETLYSVSKKYDVSVEDILAENPGLSSESFRMGTAIRIPKNRTNSNNSGSNIVFDSNYTSHKVEGKETLYSLSKQYNLSMQEVADANPEIKNSGLKKGMILRIPKVNNAANSTTDPSTGNSNQIQHEAYKTSKMQIGILLPFLDKKDQMQARFVEYYEGFLLAVEDIKKKGYSADIYVFDIRQGNSTLKLQNLLETTEIQNLDLIIGGVTDEEVSILSRFAEKSDIKYVVPFPVRNSQIIAGDNTYMANLPQMDLYNKVADKFALSNKDNNIIIVSDNAPYNEKADFIINLREALSRNYMSSKSIQAVNIATEIKDAVSLTKRNVIVPSSSSLVSLGKVVQAVKNLKTEYPAIELGLFGYPDWQAYYSQFLPEFFNNDTYIYSPFYANNNDDDVKEFHNRFQKWYSKPLIQTYPKYGLLGYDTGLYFLTALAESKNATGGKSELTTSRVSTIQSTFYFEKATQQKGYVNTGLFFIHYDQLSNNIIKIDHSK